MTDGHADEPIVVSGAPARATEVAVILLHGRGGTAQGVTNLFDPLYSHGVTFFAPQASRNRWFPRSAGAPLEENEPWLGASVDRVRTCLERARTAGVPPNRTVIVGFSQGACVAAEFLIRHPGHYGTVAILSGVVPGPDPGGRAVAGSLEGTTIYLECGDDDPYVSLEAVKASGRLFAAAGGSVTTEITTGTGHAVSERAFDALERTVERLLDERRS